MSRLNMDLARALPGLVLLVALSSSVRVGAGVAGAAGAAGSAGAADSAGAAGAGEELVGITIGAGSEAPVATTGVWDFETGTLGSEPELPSCPFDFPFAFGDSLDEQGWVPSPESELPARVEWWDPTILEPDLYPDSREVDDVGGGVLAFDLPEGYPPQSFGWMESPVIDFVELGTEPDPMDYQFHSNSPPDPEISLLQWSVGIRLFDGVEWGPWEDVYVPVIPGPASYSVPLPSFGPVCQIRVGVRNPTDTLIRKKVKKDKGRASTNPARVVAETWKYVPDIKQDGATCAAASSANCLSYWGQNGYPEIYPTDEDDSISKKHRELRKDLEDEIYGDDGEIGGEGEDADNYGGGIGAYLKKRKVDQPTEDGRSGLEHIHIDTLGASFDTLSHHFGLCHDVLLNFAWYDKDGNIWKRDGRPVQHQVTMAGLVKTNDGKTVIHVANPWGSGEDEVGPDNRDEAYEPMEVEVTSDGKVKLKNEEIQKKHKRGGFLCLREIQVVRPLPPESLLPALFATEIVSAEGGDSESYGYGVVNDQSVAVDILVLNVEVPFFDVQSPPGWTWDLLPESLPGSGCPTRYGSAGVVWRAETDPIAPGESLSGFGFSADADYPFEERGVQYYNGREGFSGRWGFVNGPVLQLTSGTDEPTQGTPGVTQISHSPNPATDWIDFRFRLETPGPVRLLVFDAQGRQVRKLSESSMDAGEHHLRWNRIGQDGRRVPAGVYFYRLQNGSRSEERRLVLIR